MAIEPYTLDPDDALAHRLDASPRAPVTIEHRGIRYRIEPEDPFAFSDPEKALAAIEASAGIFKRAGVDAEQLERDIDEMRGHGPEPTIADREAFRQIVRDVKPKQKSLEWGPETRYGREDDFNNGFNEAIDEYEAALLEWCVREG